MTPIWGFQNDPPQHDSRDGLASIDLSKDVGHWMFDAAWIFVNGLLVASCLFTLYALGWEYSTQRYLKGFSDAIVPATAPAEEKIESILAWINHGPTRLPYKPSGSDHDRDPTDTLNYDALLRVCGTATNAFINLATSSHLAVRRLLLLDAHQTTKHVVAEVLVGGKWIIVDPAYRVVFRDSRGNAVTRADLLDPATFAAATQNIPQYVPTYSFENTVHIRTAGLAIFGRSLRLILNRLLPGWDESAIMSLLVERESFGAILVALLSLIFALLLRISLRWYGQERLRISPAHFRDRLWQAGTALLGLRDQSKVNSPSNTT